MKKIWNHIKKNKFFYLLVLFSISMSLFLLMFMVSESDYFWHISAGKYMFNNNILKKDVFSWSVYSKYWMSHEWLFEIILYLIALISSKYHLLIYGFICISSLLLILLYSNKENYLKNIPLTLLWISFSIIFLSFMQGRPNLISFNLLAIIIWFLYDKYKNKESKLVYFLPIIQIIWSNVHGGSSNLVYLFCFIFFIVGLFNFKFGKIESNRLSNKQLKSYFFIGIICMIMVNLNIHGFKMFLYPYQNMLDSTMLSSIGEWAPTNLNNFRHYPYLLLVLIIVIIFLISKKKIDFIDLMLFFISILLGFKSIRFWPYTYIIMSYVIFNYVNKRRIDKGTNIIIGFISLILLLIPIFNFNIIKENIETRYLSKDILNILKIEKPKRLFNMYDYGGELVNNDIKVFIDGRADLYSKYNMKDYLSISNLYGDYQDTINKYNFDYFLVSHNTPITSYLSYSNDYKKIYSDKELILYKKTTE